MQILRLVYDNHSYKSISDQTFPWVLWLHHRWSSLDGAAALISISARRFHQNGHESLEEEERSGERNVSICRWVIEARIRKRKVMEDFGIHPLLPIHKHDLWMILRWESREVRSAFGVCHRDSVGSVNTHCSRVCVCVCVCECVSVWQSVSNQAKRLESLSTVFALHAQGVCAVRDWAFPPLFFC